MTTEKIEQKLKRLTFSCLVQGSIPSKKNNWRPAGKRIMLDPQVKAELDSITLRLRHEATRQKMPVLTDCAVKVTLFWSSGRADLDNALTSILDCLKTAGIIQNDSALHVRSVSAGFVPCTKGSEGADIQVTGVPV